MSVSRRRVLQILGGGYIVAAGGAGAFLATRTPNRALAPWRAAGASWVRLNLAATAAGFALHPVSQSLQEYPEMAAPLADVHGRLGAAGEERVQMLGRLGYGPDTPPSPRWPLESRIAPA